MCDLHHVQSLGILYAKVPNPVMDVDRPSDQRRAHLAHPPTLDAKHLWFMSLEDLCFQL
jgi:hypothetical protein